MKTMTRLMALRQGFWRHRWRWLRHPQDLLDNCKDGTYSNAASKQGACRGHQGVKSGSGGCSGCGGESSSPSFYARSGCGSSGYGEDCSGSGHQPRPGDGSCASGEGIPSVEGRGDASGGGRRSWPGMGEYVEQRLPLLWVELLRQDQGRVVLSEADAKAKGSHADHGKPAPSN